MPKILVTGGAGYIGSHAALLLEECGYDVLILDNLVYGHRELVQSALKAELIVGDIGDSTLLGNIFAAHDIAAVMHFAAFAYVGESVAHPSKYYRNNVGATLTLLEALQHAGIDKFVFSSTCATYGMPESLPICEKHPQVPINPYGASKLTVERMLSDFGAAYDLKSVIFRYFNAAGADPQGRLGEDHTPETHLLPLVLLTALGQREVIRIFGTDYPTRDGSCIRDYIHVCDLAQAHVLGLEYLLKGGSSDIFNLSNGDGFSVREIIDTARKVTQSPIAVQEDFRRPGDPHTLVGDSTKARELLGWQPQYAELETILTHAWNWHKNRHGLVNAQVPLLAA